MSYTASTSIVRFAVVIAFAAAVTACKPAPEPESPAEAAEPAASQPANQDARTFAIGDLRAVALRDGAVQFPNDNAVFGVGLRPHDVAGVLGPAGLPIDQLELSIQPLLVRTPDRVLLFDTGAGANFGAGAGKLQASLAAAGIAPADVTDVFISHLHGDHIGGLTDAMGALAFPNARLHFSRAEWAFLGGLKPDEAASFGLNNLAPLLAAISPKVVAFEPGAEIVPGVVRAVDVKGHTPGHSAFFVGSGANSILYIGDALHHHVISVQRPQWQLAFDSDRTTAAASRQELLQQNAASGQRIYAVHFPYPGVGRFTAQGGGFVWTPE